MPRPRIYANGAERARAWRQRQPTNTHELQRRTLERLEIEGDGSFYALVEAEIERLRSRVDAANAYLARMYVVRADLQTALETLNTTIGFRGAIQRAIDNLRKG